MQKIKSLFKRIYTYLQTDKFEEKNILKFLKNTNKKNMNILDIGCGYGKILKLLSNKGYSTIGIDVNPRAIKELCTSGYNAVLSKDFNTEQKFDVIILSHIVEHFTPHDLLNFLENYFSYLNDKGYVIIATPLASNYFYDDFDHIKPYQPAGLKMLFENKHSQLQYHSKFNLKLIDLRFRYAPLRLIFNRCFYIKSSNKIPFFINIILSVLFKLSFKILGRVDGWIGLLQIKKEII